MCLYSDKSGTFSDGKKFLCEENANFATDMSRAKYKLWKITRYGLSGETDLREGVGKIRQIRQIRQKFGDRGADTDRAAAAQLYDEAAGKGLFPRGAAQRGVGL